ncbi:MAG TPA: hypothetical protein VNK96_07220 [Fimbriimonadales bacterium]|nr:hypothetical protein [Fimbriimonadales bacterium]
MSLEEIETFEKRLFRALAGLPAEKYAQEVLIPSLGAVLGLSHPTLEEIKESLKEALASFKAVLAYYGIFRRGTEREMLSKMMLTAIERTLDDSPIEEFFRSKDSEALWISFLEVCEETHKKPMEQMNRPFIEGVCKLCFELFEITRHGSIFLWIYDEVCAAHRVEHVFNRLVDIRTFGPKTASHILRDAVFLYDLEKHIVLKDRLYLLPINNAIRVIGEMVLPEATTHLADWILAGKISRAIRNAGVSIVRVSMGATYVAIRASETSESIEKALRKIA